MKKTKGVLFYERPCRNVEQAAHMQQLLEQICWDFSTSPADLLHCRTIKHRHGVTLQLKLATLWWWWWWHIPWAGPATWHQAPAVSRASAACPDAVHAQCRSHDDDSSAGSQCACTSPTQYSMHTKRCIHKHWHRLLSTSPNATPINDPMHIITQLFYVFM